VVSALPALPLIVWLSPAPIELLAAPLAPAELAAAPLLRTPLIAMYPPMTIAAAATTDTETTISVSDVSQVAGVDGTVGKEVG
jgi:hypothetical protein